jgi:hypothetical protein
MRIYVLQWSAFSISTNFRRAISSSKYSTVAAPIPTPKPSAKPTNSGGEDGGSRSQRLWYAVYLTFQWSEKRAVLGPYVFCGLDGAQWAIAERGLRVW